nr:hypothetical protein [Tanacetum cinerariifolium]
AEKGNEPRPSRVHSRADDEPNPQPTVHHGEPNLPPPPPVIDNTRQPQMSDMTALLNDLSYIPSNNEHSEPTQGDISETSNEPTQDTRNEFEELYASANEKLYPEFFQNVFPISKGYKLPPSYYAIKKTFKTIESSFMLTLLIPGPKSPGKDIDVYLRPLIEDLKDDMLKAQIKVVDILCDLELVYPPALFDIMIHLVIHLPLEALEGGPIRPRWMFPFERYMKKLKGYVRNKAKPEGTIVEGYVVEEALTFNSHYFRDVTMKFNRSDRNVDPPPPKCQFQVFRSIRQRHVNNDKDPEVSKTSELFALASGPTWTPISINSYVVDGVRYLAHSRDERRTTQNSSICSPGPDREMYYGQLQEILEFKNNMTQIDTRSEAFKNDQYILVTQVKQVFYLEDKAKPHWKVVEHVNHKKFSDGGVIMVEDDPDIIHFDNSSDLPLSTSLNDLDNATLHIDGQSTKVDAPLDIIDVVDEDDIIDDEDTLLHDLADSDDEDLINVDDDGVDKMSADVARSHSGDGGGEDRPPPHYVPSGCEGCFTNRGKGKRKPNLEGRAAGRLSTRDKTQNLSLKETTDTKGPVPIRFEVCDKQTLMPLGEHAAHCSSYIGDVIRGVPLYHPFWLKVPKERKAALIADIGTQFDLRPHIESPDWTEIHVGIQQHLQKAYNTNKAAFKAQHWVIDPTTRTYNVEKIRRARPQNITTDEWDKGRAQPLRCTRRSLTPSSWHTLLTGNFFGMRTDEMRRLEATGTYTDDEISHLARGGKQRGHIPGVGRVLPARATASPISLGIVAGEGIPVEHSPANIPQRQVAGKSPEMSLGNVVNVVVPPLELPSWPFQKITNTITHDEHGFICHKA